MNNSTNINSNKQTIYCISSGDYEDWHIDYAFTDKDKRDKLLCILNQEEHSDDSYPIDAHEPYDLDLNDDFDFTTVKNINYVKCKYTRYADDTEEFDFDLVKTNSLLTTMNSSVRNLYKGARICDYSRYITVCYEKIIGDEQLAKGIDELEEIYLNKCREIYSKDTSTK